VLMITPKSINPNRRSGRLSEADQNPDCIKWAEMIIYYE